MKKFLRAYALPLTMFLMCVSGIVLSQTSGLPAPSVASVNDGVHSGIMALYGNTTLPTIPANQFGWLGFNSTSAAALFLQPTVTPPVTGQLMSFSTPTSNVSQQTWVGPTSIATTAQCLAATSPILTHCVAYSSGATTALTTSYVGTLQTLYTSAAPAGSSFLLCPTIFQESGTATPTGTAQMLVNWTTAGGSALTNVGLENITFATGGGVGNGGCTTVSLAAGSTFSVQMKAVSATGTVAWSYNLTVTRIS